MTLRELLGDGPDVVVTSLTFDNRLVGPGSLFFCVPGFTRDGHDFAPDAVARGAAALVVARPLGLGVPEVLVERRAGGDGARRGAVLRRSDGHAAGRRDHRHERQDHDRVPRPRAARGRGAARAACSARSSRSSAARSGRSCGRRRRRSTSSARSGRCSTAATSRARWRSPRTRSELRRSDGIHVAAAVFTNLTQDHLDFHPTMEDYFAGQAAAVRVRADGACGSRTPTTRTAGG